MRNLITPLLSVAAVVSVLSTNSAHADLGDQLFELVSGDGTGTDQFGRRVAIYGTIAIVGENLDDDNGNRSGSAYLFDTTTGLQISKLLADDGTQGDLFGFSVAISGNTVIVGAIYEDGNETDSGSAYIFDITNPKNPIQITKLLANDGETGDSFGWSVAISGNKAIVGAHDNDDNGSFSGSAYIFDVSNGQQIFKLIPDDNQEGDLFGFCVAASGNIAIIGAWGDDDNGAFSGSAYLFDISTGAQIVKLLAKDGVSEDFFGRCVAISETTILIGARGDDDNGSSSGSVYIFDISKPAIPIQTAKVLANDGAGFDNFGNSVSLNGSMATIGASSDNDDGNNSGSAYVFDISNPAKPLQLVKLLPSHGEPFDHFGRSVAIGGESGNEVALVGRVKENNTGSAFVFDASGFTSCPWDLDNTGSVGTIDLLTLLGQWGTAGSADFDGSGEVGTGDLLILLANWGPCE